MSEKEGVDVSGRMSVYAGAGLSMRQQSQRVS